MAFLIFPTKTNSFNVESLRGHAVAKGLKDTIDEIQKEIGVRLYETCLRGHVPDPHDLLSKNDLVKLKRCIFAQGASNLPPITTHNIVEDQNDPVMNAFRRCQLFNNHHDRVKVQFDFYDFIPPSILLLALQTPEFCAPFFHSRVVAP